MHRERGIPVSRRMVVVLASALVLAIAAVVLLRDGELTGPERPTVEEMARSAGADVMTMVYRGHVANRSGQIMLVPKPYSFMVGDWNLENFGTDTPTVTNSHPNPWSYLVHVPVLLYGPGRIPAGQEVSDPVDVTGLAATYGQWLRVRGFDPDGHALPGVGEVGSPPKVIVTVVIDGAGWNVLQTYPESWPNMRRLKQRGTMFTNATVGSVPSVTGPIHTNIGTGSYPRRHKIPSNPIIAGSDPRHIRTPTVSDVWAAQTGDRAITAMVAYEGFHIGMLGHGAGRDGGDPDIAVLWTSKRKGWWARRPNFYVPDYVHELGVDDLARYERDLDARDGVRDGRWFRSTPAELRKSYARYATPSFVQLTADVLDSVLDNEPIGRDDVTDLLWVEFKSPDYAAHAWTLTGPEIGDTLYEVDRQIGALVDRLDATIGRDGYVLAISTDHGAQPFPELHGGWRINAVELQRDIEREFGDVVALVTPTDVRVNKKAVEEGEVSLEDVASFIGAYTIGENIAVGKPGAGRVPEGLKDQTLFAGAFPTDFIESLDPETISSFGEGDYGDGG